MDPTADDDRPASAVPRGLAVQTLVGVAIAASAVLALVVSVVPSATAATGAATWWLEAMHLVVFTALVAAMSPSIPSRPVTGRMPLGTPVHGGAA